MKTDGVALLTVISLPLLLFFIPASAQEKTTISTVVIDAGHGGRDPGTVGKHIQEKYVTLAIALKTGEKIRELCRDVKVIFTRDTDRFVELFQRTEIANRNKADLFISIHCNANPSAAFQGAETYIMGLHRTNANLEIAKLENAAILMEPDYETTYKGFDPNSDESYITFTIFQNAYLEQSMKFASLVQEEISGKTGLNDRGVRQAGFLVLYRTTMPSVLIETGFLSNPEEEKYLMSEKGEEFIASAIAKAFVKFKASQEAGRSQAAVKDDKIAPAGGKQLPDLFFRVQLAALAKEVPVKSPIFRNVSDVRMYRQDGKYKYTAGNVKTLEEAQALLEKIKGKGFSDAFLVAFRNEERIPLSEAKKLLGIKE